MTQKSSGTPDSYAVFEHEKRREWGLGVLAWESGDRRGYVFENGQVRIVAEPFYALMREVDRPLDEVQALYQCLKPELDAARAERSSVLPAKPAAAKMSFDDQVAVFRAEYPDAFEDAQWVEQQRGTGAKKRRAAYRDPAITQAQEILGAEALESRIAEQDFKAIHDDVYALLRGTDLVPSAEVTLFASADPAGQRALAPVLLEFCHGEGGLGPRFDQFLAAFQQAVKKPAGWQLATTLLALLDPAEHVSVRPAAFRTQAKWVAPRLTIPKLPSGASYMRILAMSKVVLTKLEEAGEKPRDMLDVHDFIRVTTRPAAKQRLAELKRAAP